MFLALRVHFMIQIQALHRIRIPKEEEEEEIANAKKWFKSDILHTTSSVADGKNH